MLWNILEGLLETSDWSCLHGDGLLHGQLEPDLELFQKAGLPFFHVVVILVDTKGLMATLKLAPLPSAQGCSWSRYCSVHDNQSAHCWAWALGGMP